MNICGWDDHHSSKKECNRVESEFDTIYLSLPRALSPFLSLSRSLSGSGMCVLQMGIFGLVASVNL